MPHVQGSYVRLSLISIMFTSERGAILHRVPDYFVVPWCRWFVSGESAKSGVLLVFSLMCVEYRGIIVSHG